MGGASLNFAEIRNYIIFFEPKSNSLPKFYHIKSLLHSFM